MVLTKDEKEIIKLLDHIYYKGLQYQPTDKEITQIKNKQLLLKTLKNIIKEYEKDYLARTTIKKYKPTMQYIEFEYYDKNNNKTYKLSTWDDCFYGYRHGMPTSLPFTGKWRKVR